MDTTNASKEPEKENDSLFSSLRIFQCKACRTVIGDSLSFLYENTKSHNFSLQGASNITRSMETETSLEGDDRGSTYHLLHCEQCESNIGKVYLTTSKTMDHLRDVFTFFSDSILVYQLGSTPDSEVPITPGEQSSSKPTTEEILHDLTKDLTKVQNVILVLHERIQGAENSMMEQYPNEKS